MNSHSQPQNTSPYPQNNNLYPQINPHYTQGTQSGPSKYPTLPPIHNPQHNPQPYPQYNYHTGRSGGYVPPAHYGNVQSGPVDDESIKRQRLAMRMGELEGNLNSCSIKCYKVWSYMTVIWASLWSWPIFIELKAYQKDIPEAYLIPAFIYALWIILQSIVAIYSINKRSSKAANMVWWMMIISLIAGLVYEGLFIRFLITYPYRHTLPPYFMAQVLCCLCSVYLVLHVGVNMVGSFKVRKILEERAKVQSQLMSNSF